MRHICLITCLCTIGFIPVSLYSQIYLDLQAKTDMRFQEIVDSTEAFYDVIGREKGKGYKPFQRWKYEAERSLDSEGRIKTSVDDYNAYRAYQAKNPPGKYLSGSFTELGPLSATNTITWSSALGRFSALGLDINNPDHLITGSPSGGVWRTRDGGNTWDPIYDFALEINIWSLEISHSDPDYYFAGTGDGIFYSTDAGYTWEKPVSGPPNSEINAIIMDPNDSNILLASHRYGEKIWRSSDGGINWNVVHTPGNDCYDIEFVPGNPNIVYASGKGFIAKSTDNGISWNNLTGPWGNGVIMMAVSAANANYLYALQEVSGGYNATYRSVDQGLNWTTQSDNSSGTNNILTYNQSQPGGQAPRDMDICISPSNINEVYVAGTELWRSLDGGVTFTKIADWLVNSGLPFIHADVDLLYYNENAFYAGTDGGLFVSEDNAVSWTDWTTGTGVRQFYRIGSTDDELDRVSGGSQDNGTGTLINGTWYDWVGADGMETLIDWSDKDVIYTNIQFGGLYKTTNGGNSFAPITNTPGSGAWVTPFEQDPDNSNTLYQGKEEVYKTTNGGSSWTMISNLGLPGKCTEIEIAPSNNQYIYASWGVNLYASRDGGSNWVDISPGGFINYIDVHPDDALRLAVAQSGKIYESTDGGLNWADITGNLPDITYYCVLYADDGNMGMYLGGRPGVCFKDNNSSGNWSNVSFNLPVVQVRELEIRNNFLYVATYGRGLWKAGLGTEHGFSCATASLINEPGYYTAPGPVHGNGCYNCSDGSTHANWFKFDVPDDGKLSIKSCHAGVDTRLWVYSGSCGNLTEIASSDDDCAITPGSGNMYASHVEDLAVSNGQMIFIEWDDAWSDDDFFWSLEFCSDAFSGPRALTGVIASSETYETDGLIDSDQLISNPAGEVIYDSKIAINFLPGFEIQAGVIFEALADGCGGAH